MHTVEDKILSPSKSLRARRQNKGVTKIMNDDVADAGNDGDGVA